MHPLAIYCKENFMAGTENANFRKPVPSCLVIFRLYYASKLEPSQDI